jgi:hypothetical protein
LLYQLSLPRRKASSIPCNPLRSPARFPRPRPDRPARLRRPMGDPVCHLI